MDVPVKIKSWSVVVWRFKVAPKPRWTAISIASLRHRGEILTGLDPDFDEIRSRKISICYIMTGRKHASTVRRGLG